MNTLGLRLRSVLRSLPLDFARGERVLALGALAVLSVGCDSTKGDRLLRMDTQPKYKYYQQSEFWQDGQAMRIPPAGTISREQRQDLPLLDWTNEDGTYKDAFPKGLVVDTTFLETGKRKYEIVCATCHGITGDGRSIPGENMQLHPGPSFVALKDKPVGYFFEVSTHGFGLMPSFAGELSVRDRWAVAGYIKALGYSRAVPVAELPPAEQQKLNAQPAEVQQHGAHHEEKKETL